MTVGTVPITGRHILTVGASITHGGISILAIDGNGKFRFLIKYLLGEALLHCIPYGSHHPCRPGLVEPLQHDAEAAVDYIIDGLGSPSLVNHFKWCTLKPQILCEDRKNG